MNDTSSNDTHRAPYSEHYAGDVEPIDLIKASGFSIAFCLGNVIKYCARSCRKGNPLGDLEKAQWYLNYAVNYIKERSAINTNTKSSGGLVT